MTRHALLLVLTFAAGGAAFSPLSAGIMHPHKSRRSCIRPSLSLLRAKDPAANLVDNSPLIRQALAFPVAFASSTNWLAQCIYAATKLGVFDALENGPLTVDVLAAQVEADSEALGRLMRALGGQGPIIGLVVEVFDPPFALPFAPPFPIPIFPLLRFGKPARLEGQRLYALTPLGAMLRSGSPGSVRPWVMFSGEELGQAWGGLLDAVVTGAPDFAATQRGGLSRNETKNKKEPGSRSGSGFFEYLALHPEAQARFDATMEVTSNYLLDVESTADIYDWSRGGLAKTVVDVGGGTGTFLAAILIKHPSLFGTLFDQEQVVAGSGAVLAKVASRTEVVAGSFFETVPEGKDVYTLKNIVHDWSDDDATDLLSVVAAAMQPNSRLVILDSVRSAREGHEPWKLDSDDYLDLNMLVTVGGKERTLLEWERLVACAGLEIVSVSSRTGISAIETCKFS